MRRLAVLLVLLAVPLAGCAGTAARDPSPQSPASQSSAPRTPAPQTHAPQSPASQSPASQSPASQTPAPQTVALQRTGGIAGNRDTVTVQPDGSWRRTARGRPSTGTLTADQNDALVRMEAELVLGGESGRRPAPIECADGYHLSVTVGETTVQWQDCGSVTTQPPVAARIATFLLDSAR
jgi:hypothetical protein